VGAELPEVRCADSGGCAAAQAAGQSAAEQRQVLCRVRNSGTGQRPGVAGQGHKRFEPALAKEKCRQEKSSGGWFAEQVFFACQCGNGSGWLIPYGWRDAIDTRIGAVFPDLIF
jgi:hypothetical protein